MKKRILSIIIALAIMIPYGGFAAATKVNVSLPVFDIHINGEEIDNANRQYPFILYKGITYFPMTYDDCRSLGLEVQWTREEGLIIEQGGGFAEHKQQTASVTNPRNLQASLATGQITVNGKKVDNSEEEYPLLLYRDITYFPLTWRFAVEKFNWSYSFNSMDGLSITSSGISIKSLKLPYEVKGGVAPSIIEGYYYYVTEIGEEGYVYRAPVNNPQMASRVQKLENGKDYNPHVGFFKLEDEIIFSNYIGGATMGSYRYYRVNSEGLGEHIISGRYSVKLYKDAIIAVSYFVPPYGNNLYHISPATGSYSNMGEANLMYGWSIQENGGYSSNTAFEIYKDEFYVTAIDTTEGSPENKLYKIDIETNTTTTVSELSIVDFSIDGDTLYFLEKTTGNLYSKDLINGEEKMLVKEKVQEYSVYEGEIFYITEKGLYKYTSADSKEGIVADLRVAHLKIHQGYIILQLHYDEPYGLVILDSDGREVFKATDKIVSTSAENNLLVFTVYESRNNFVLELPQ